MPALLVRLPAESSIDELPGVQTALMCQDGPGDDLRLWVNFMRPTGLANMHITLGCGNVISAGRVGGSKGRP